MARSSGVIFLRSPTRKARTQKPIVLYGMGLEGSFQTGGTVSDGAFITAMVLILLAIFFMLLGFAAEAREKRRRKVHQQPRNTVKSGRKAG